MKENEREKKGGMTEWRLTLLGSRDRDIENIFRLSPAFTVASLKPPDLEDQSTLR